MKKEIFNLDRDIVIPSSVFSVPKKDLKFYKEYDRAPEVGDVVYGVVQRIGQHKTIENKSGRIHNLYNDSKVIGVFGNRYAPDYYEGVVPGRKLRTVDMLARSGVFGKVRVKNTAKIDPTHIKILGYVCDKKGKVINTKKYSLITPKKKEKKSPRAKMILVCGTAMNSGKSTAASAIIWALRSAGYKVRASKVTGTASLKDILRMNDAGAQYYSDFTHLGYPSTYLESKKDILKIFNTLDLKYANNPDNYWVVEFADGINQRETQMLIESSDVKDRIDKFIFCAADTFGAIGGIDVLERDFNLTPDAISGVCTSSPLMVDEIANFTDVPVFKNTTNDPQEILKTLGIKKKKVKK